VVQLYCPHIKMCRLLFSSTNKCAIEHVN
jgi:hypothetical protein